MVVWEGVDRKEADTAYEVIRDRVGKFGKVTNRRCEANAPKTCACQGLNQERNGASFTFGCSWSMYFKGCKFARTNDPSAVRKFRVDDSKTKACADINREEMEAELEEVLGNMATGLTGIFGQVAPDCKANMTACSEQARHCRIGFNKNEFGDPKPSERPFSGVTCVTDFCAHSHRDSTNMIGGCTAVVTLTRPENRCFGEKVDDEQFHVLPHYAPDTTDEYGNKFEIRTRIAEGALEVLQKYDTVTAVREKPSKATKRGHPKADMKAFLDQNYRIKVGRMKSQPSSAEGPKPRGSPRGKRAKNAQHQQPQQDGYPRFNASLNHAVYPAQNGGPAAAVPPPPPAVQGGVNQRLLFLPAAQWGAAAIPQTDGNDDSDAAAAVSSSSAHFVAPELGNGAAVSKSQLLREYRIHPKQQQQQAPLPTAVSSVLSPPESEPNSDVGSASPGPTGMLPPLPALVPYEPTGEAGLPPTPPIKAEVKSEPWPTPPGWPAPQAHFNRQNVPPNHRVDLTTPVFRDVKQEMEVKAEPKYIPHVPQISMPRPDEPIKEEIHVPQREEESTTTIYEDNEPVRVSLGRTDNAEAFADDDVGGLAISLPHGSVLFECALEELHATTALKAPNRHRPTRIGLVFYQHHDLNMPEHGSVLKSERKKAISDRDHKAIMEGKFSPTKRKLMVRKRSDWDDAKLRCSYT